MPRRLNDESALNRGGAQLVRPGQVAGGEQTLLRSHHIATEIHGPETFGPYTGGRLTLTSSDNSTSIYQDPEGEGYPRDFDIRISIEGVKGQLIVSDGLGGVGTTGLLPPGEDDEVLTADSAAELGVAWKAPAGGGTDPYEEDPEAVAATADPGDVDEYARGNHVHLGVTSIEKDDGPASGAITLTGTAVIQDGTTFTINLGPETLPEGAEGDMLRHDGDEWVVLLPVGSASILTLYDDNGHATEFWFNNPVDSPAIVYFDDNAPTGIYALGPPTGPTNGILFFNVVSGLYEWLVPGATDSFIILRSTGAIEVMEAPAEGRWGINALNGELFFYALPTGETQMFLVYEPGGNLSVLAAPVSGTYTVKAIDGAFEMVEDT